MGQTAFAIAAMLLWMNTPDLSTARLPQSVPPEHARAGTGMTIALACAIGQGATAMMVETEYAPISGALMIAAAAMSLAVAATLAGTSAAIRVGAWAATYGVLLAFGAMSLARLLPAALHMLREGEAAPINRIASGFGAYAIEALALLGLAGLIAAQPHIHSPLRRTLGMVLIIVAAALAAWRLAAL
jgi:hypothetical protein